MKLFSAKNLLQKPGSKFIFEVGSGAEFSGSSVETRQTPVATGTERPDSIKDIYEKVRGKLTPDEISEDTQQKLFQEYTKFDTTEKAADNKIGENNSKIAGHKANIDTLSSERQQLSESNDSEAESNIILGLMPNSHEDFIQFVKSNRPGQESIRSFLQSDQLETIPEDQITQVTELAGQMVVKLNRIDELTQKITLEEAEVKKLEASNKEEEEKKKANQEQATAAFEAIIAANVSPSVLLPGLESLGSPDTCAVPHTNSDTLMEGVALLVAPSENLKQIEETLPAELSPEAKAHILSIVERLSYDPSLTSEEAVSVVLAGLVTDGTISQEQANSLSEKESNFYKLILERIDIAKRSAEIDAETDRAARLAEANSLVQWHQMFTGSQLLQGVLSSETISEFRDLEEALEGEDTNDINQQALEALIRKAYSEVANAHKPGHPYYETYSNLSTEERTAFASAQNAMLRKMSNTEFAAKALATRIEESERIITEAEKSTDIVETLIEDPAHLREVARTNVYRQTGKVGAAVAEFLTNPDSDLSTENIQKVVNLLNSDDYLNATPEQQAQLFQNAGINLNSSEFTPSNAQIITPEIQGWAADTPGVTIEGIDPENGLIIVSLGNDEESEYRLDPEKGLIHQKGLDTAFSDDLYIDADKPAAAQAMGGLIKSQYLSTSDSPAFDARAFGNNELNEFFGNYYAKRGGEPLPYSEAQSWETLGQALRIANSGLGALVEATSNEDVTNDLTGEVTLSSAGTKAASSRIEEILDRARAVTPDQLAVEIKAILGN